MNDKLLKASEIGNVNEVIRLINSGADVNHADPYGYGLRPLHFTVRASYPDNGEKKQGAGTKIAELLIKAGADVNGLDRKKSTPLHHYDGMIPVDIVRVLKEAGADLSIKNEAGYTPLDQIKYNLDSKKDMLRQLSTGDERYDDYQEAVDKCEMAIKILTDKS